MAIVPSDIKFYESKSNGTADGQATGDGLGKYRSSDLITSNTANNVWDNVIGAESTTGDTEYRAVFVKNTHASLTLESAVVWIDTDLPVTTLTSGIDADDETLPVANADNFPEAGAVFIENEEIAYTSKTTGGSDSLNGCTRGSNSTTPATHAEGAHVEHNQIRIAIEEPSNKSSGYIQSITNESTAPSGISWSAVYTQATGLSIGDLAPGEFYGIWMRRKVPLGCGPKTNAYATFKIMGETAE